MKKIAIVEDDPVISGQLADFLMNNGYECSGVTDYANCVEQILAAGGGYGSPGSDAARGGWDGDLKKGQTELGGADHHRHK